MLEEEPRAREERNGLVARCGDLNGAPIAAASIPGMAFPFHDVPSVNSRICAAGPALLSYES